VKVLTPLELEETFRSWDAGYDLRVPIRLPDGTRAWGKIDEGPLALRGGPILAKPTAFFFPQSETELEYEETGKLRLPSPPSRPFLLVGLTAQDAESIAFVDEFFRANFQDDLYFRRREGAVIVVVWGRCGQNGELLRRAKQGCDLELVWDGERLLLIPRSERGWELYLAVRGGKEEEASPSLEEMEKEAACLMAADEELLRRSSALLLEDRIPDQFWEEVSKSCIACTACNLLCPTCTCFEVYDWKEENKVERRRLWDSCQLEGFAREASGHNPLGTEASRTRRRIHHKLGADAARWGRITCFLCGRCDVVCPTGLGIKALSREMVRRYGP